MRIGCGSVRVSFETISFWKAYMLRKFLTALERIGHRPEDTPDDRLKKTILTVVSVLFALAGLLWGLTYIQLGMLPGGYIPLGYGIVSLLTLMYFIVTKRYNFFRFSQIFLIWLLPFALQLSLGGFVASSGVILWSLIGTLEAFMFTNRRQAFWWLSLFLFSLLTAGLLDAGRAEAAVLPPEPVIRIFFVLNIGTVSIFVFILIYYFAREKEREQEKSEALLLNILPKPIAERLKNSPGTIADGYASVTVLFADIVGFTELSARITPKEVVNLLNEIFTAFDSLAEKHGLEKIKTIGDAYMVVGGLPEERADHAAQVAEMALEMRDYLKSRFQGSQAPVSARIGINTGPVVAGVIGRKKFIYDLWGDAVNTASRMESHGVSDAIQVSSSTYQLLKNRYSFKERGGVEIKGKGMMMTYLLLERETA